MVLYAVTWFYQNYTPWTWPNVNRNSCSTSVNTRMYPKVPRAVLVKRSLLTLDVKFLHHLQSTPLLHEYSGPSISAMLGRIPGSPFLELCQVPAAIPLESLQWCRIFGPSSEASAWGRGKCHRGPDRVCGMGDHCHVVLGQKLRYFKGPVSRGIVVVDNEVLVLPFLWPLAPHIFT